MHEYYFHLSYDDFTELDLRGCVFATKQLAIDEAKLMIDALAIESRLLRKQIPLRIIVVRHSSVTRVIAVTLAQRRSFEMILPGNSRQVIVDAINDSPIAPHATTSKIVSDLTEAGYGIVHRNQLSSTLSGLLSIIRILDKNSEFLNDKDVERATALRTLLAQ